MKSPFLTCNWQNLLYINFHVDAQKITPFLPEDIEPSIINGKTIISLVCFEFSKASFFGIKIPFHQYFPDINVRVYVQRKNYPDLKGVYFISEMVPKLMTVLVAKNVFGEPFSLKKIKCNISKSSIQYKAQNEDFFMVSNLNFDGISPRELNEEEKFVIEKEYAFCGKAGKYSKLFLVKHQKWNLLNSSKSDFKIKKINHLPEVLQNIFLNTQPSSIFATDGSYVEVFNLN